MTETLTSKIFQGTVIIAFAGVMSKFFIILTAPILTKILGPESYGVIALINSLIALGVMFSSLGIDLTYTRFSSGEDKVKNEIFCWRFSFFMSTVIALILIVFGLHLSHINNNIPKNMFYLSAVCCFFTATIIMSQTRLRIEGRYLKIGLTMMLSSFLSVMTMVVLAIYWRQDAWVFLIGNLIGLGITITILKVPNLRYLSEKINLSIHEKFELIKFGLIGSAISAPLYWVISTLDRWFISLCIDTYELGIFNFAFGIAILGQLLNTALVSTWKTEISVNLDYKSENAKSKIGDLFSKIIIKLGLVWLAVSAIGCDLLMLISDEKFHKGIQFIPWIAGGVFFYGISQIASTGMLIKKDMKYFSYWYLVAATMSIILNIIYVPKYGAVASAVIQCVSFFVAAAGIFYSSQKIYYLDFNLRNIIIFLPLIVFFGFLLSIPLPISLYISLILKIIIIILFSIFVINYIVPDWHKTFKKYN